MGHSKWLEFNRLAGHKIKQTYYLESEIADSARLEDPKEESYQEELSKKVNDWLCFMDLRDSLFMERVTKTIKFGYPIFVVVGSDHIKALAEAFPESKTYDLEKEDEKEDLLHSLNNAEENIPVNTNDALQAYMLEPNQLHLKHSRSRKSM